MPPGCSRRCDDLEARRLCMPYGFEKVGKYDFPIGEWIDRDFIMRRRGRITHDRMGTGKKMPETYAKHPDRSDGGVAA
jgi:hypothetical protein